MKKIVVGIVGLFLLILFGNSSSLIYANNEAKVKVGAASESVLPLVNGSLDYFEKGDLPDEYNTDSMGIFVEEFDVGQLVVGNGGDDAHWVRDDIRVSAMAIENKQDKNMVAVLTSNLYMIFKEDAELIREKTRQKLNAEGINHNNLEIIVTADHNHHGPDTAWDINREWFDYMVDKASDSIVNAIKSREDARLYVGEGDHWYGLMDSRDPQIIDPTMNVLQAKNVNGDVISTLVLWNAHPEMTLGVEFEVENLEEICNEDYWHIDKCTTKGQYLTSDFVGPMGKAIQDEVGGEFLYLQGPLGGQMSHRFAPLWEITEEHGIGDSFTPPEGAELLTEKRSEHKYNNDSFRRQIVVGEQAGIAALNIIQKGEEITNPKISFTSDAFYLRLTNIGFSYLSVPKEGHNYSNLGYRPMKLYTCSDIENKNDDTCIDDEYEAVEDPLLGKVRKGDHLRAEVGYLQIGNMGMMLTPAEMMSELVVGFPKGFLDNPEKWFENPNDMQYHATDDYEIPGYVKNRMNDTYKWVVSLGNDELGYAVPMSDYRIGCAADALAGDGTCLELYENGLIQYEDGLSGEYCKLITEDPSEIEDLPEEVQQALLASCKYGQADFRAQDHYHETMSASWDLADEILNAVARLTGNDNAEMTNPNLAGHWYGNPPPVVENPVKEDKIKAEEAGEIAIAHYGGNIVNIELIEDESVYEVELKDSTKGHILVYIDALSGEVVKEIVIDEPTEPEDPNGNKDEDPENPSDKLKKEVYAKLTKEKKRVLLQDEDINLLDDKGKLFIELTGEYSSIEEIVISKDQIKELKKRNALLVISNDDIVIEIPTVNFEDEELIIKLNEINTSKSAMSHLDKVKSKVYDISFTQNKKRVTSFKKEIRLKFKVVENEKNHDNLSLFYWDEEEDVWTLMESEQKEDYVISLTDHFSIFAVFNEEDINVPAAKISIKDEKDGGVSKKEMAMDGKPGAKGSKLPSTATNMYTGIFAGIVLIVVGAIIYYLRYRKSRKGSNE